MIYSPSNAPRAALLWRCQVNVSHTLSLQVNNPYKMQGICAKIKLIEIIFWINFTAFKITACEQLLSKYAFF